MNIKEHYQVLKRASRCLFSEHGKYTWLFIVNPFLTSIVYYIPIYFSAKVIDALIVGSTMEIILFYVALTVGIVFMVNILNTYISEKKEIAFDAIWRQQEWSYSQKAMEMDYASIEIPELNRLRYRIKMESQTGWNLFYLYQGIERSTGEITKISASMLLTVSFFSLSSIPLVMKLGIIAGLLIMILMQLYTTGKTVKLDRKFMESGSDLNVIMAQFFDYIENYSTGMDIRLYKMGTFLGDSYYSLEKNFYDINLKNSYKKALWTLPRTILSTGLKLGIYGVLIYAAIQGGITIGSIAKYVACIMLLSEAVINLVETVQKMLDNNHYLKRYFSYFDIPNEMYKGSLTVEKRDDREYDVEFRNVIFKYPNTDTYALKNVNLKFKIGEKLAIVGMNGSGKTTFIKLLCRLYDPTEGEILLNGVNIQKYDYDEYMSVFSVVFQDFSLFSYKLGEVVASSRDYDEERVIECLEKANYGERFQTMPEGVHTYLYQDYDPSGIEISGGEAQKIALARALYKDAPFILLDEPTAALDPISEYEVYSNFNSISGDKTAVYISHRLASCKFCDKIAVFHEGQIVQTGGHEELLADADGKYAELWNAQAQYYVK